MGFKDGTQTPAQIDKVVWVGDDGPAWMRGGSYVVVRRIRMALEHWDRTNVGFQEQTFGREKYSGAPLGLKDEFEPLGLDRTDKDENPVIPENAHVRLANAASNDGAEVLRRGYSYNDGVNFTAERWPPWRQGMEYDAGLFFVCYQRDPRTGFIKIFENMAKFDMLNQFVTHTGGGLFACPGGVRAGRVHRPAPVRGCIAAAPQPPATLLRTRSISCATASISAMPSTVRRIPCAA